MARQTGSRTPIRGAFDVRNRSTAHAYTLVELLVTLGIISLLAGLLFPLLAFVRAKSGQTVCASNLGQIGKAALLYMQDHDGGIPPLTNQFLGPRFNMDHSPIDRHPQDRPDYLWEVVGSYLKHEKSCFAPAILIPIPIPSDGLSITG